LGKTYEALMKKIKAGIKVSSSSEDDMEDEDEDDDYGLDEVTKREIRTSIYFCLF
jgi:hypothetical protein